MNNWFFGTAFSHRVVVKANIHGLFEIKTTALKTFIQSLKLNQALLRVSAHTAAHCRSCKCPAFTRFVIMLRFPTQQYTCCVRWVIAVRSHDHRNRWLRLKSGPWKGKCQRTGPEIICRGQDGSLCEDVWGRSLSRAAARVSSVCVTAEQMVSLQ